MSAVTNWTRFLWKTHRRTVTAVSVVSIPLLIFLSSLNPLKKSFSHSLLFFFYKASRPHCYGVSTNSFLYKWFYSSIVQTKPLINPPFKTNLFSPPLRRLPCCCHHFPPSSPFNLLLKLIPVTWNTFIKWFKILYRDRVRRFQSLMNFLSDSKT